MIKKMQATSDSLEIQIDGIDIYFDAQLRFTRTVYGGDYFNESTLEDTDFETEYFNLQAWDEHENEVHVQMTEDIESSINQKIIEELQSEAEEV